MGDNSSLLYVHQDTFNCAVGSKCIACLYKLCPSGFVGSMKLPNNIRPEMCPRHFKGNSKRKNVSLNSLYFEKRVLTVGDGDFSFSLSLAEQGVSSLVATSYESGESVTRTYPTVSHTLPTLRDLRVPIHHDVDATNIQVSCPALDAHLKYFDIIVWNFPCVAEVKGADGQSDLQNVNKQLLRDFFDNAKKYLVDGGEIHVTHKTIEPFCWWGIIELGIASGLYYHGSVVFDRCLFPGYMNRKALDKKSFPLHDAQTYIFGVPATGKKASFQKRYGKETAISLCNDYIWPMYFGTNPSQIGKKGSSSDKALKCMQSIVDVVTVLNEESGEKNKQKVSGLNDSDVIYQASNGGTNGFKKQKR